MNAADALARRLAELGVRRIWGEALPVSDAAAASLDHQPVGEADLAVLLADADGRIGEVDGRGRLGAALLPGPILHLSSRPGGTAALRTVGSPIEMLDALVDPVGLDVPATTALHLDFDVTAEVPADIVATAQPERRPVLTLDPSMAGLRILTIVGPGVVRAGGIEGLGNFSRTAGSGVLNTWGAKGVERWDSPWHFGTIGPQQRDLELAEVASADVLVVSGLDPQELSVQDIGHPLTQEVPPTQLGALCARWDTSAEAPDSRPPLYGAISEVVTPAYEDDTAPLSAPRACLHLSGALPQRAMAVADAGRAGFWVARTFPTSIPNSVVVPTDPGVSAGFAAAAALVCAVEGRPCLAVSDSEGASAAETAAVLAFAEELGLGVALQVWRDPAEEGGLPMWDSADRHVELLRQHLSTDVVRVDDVPVRLGDLAGLERVAGSPRSVILGGSAT
ncbi:MAG: hypothetical protein ACK5O2_09555 [Microthrixaceae bacterium]